MLALVFTFPAGRYHATPWGRHVNEADVAWPPEPWRILRALAATWFRKADRDAFSEDALAALIDRLAEQPPDYALPTSVVHAHSRHYMPQAAAGDTKLVFDAFARFPAGEPIVVEWPHLTLEDDALALLRHLAERIGYLGRAESWAVCEVRTEKGPWTINCRASASDDSGEDDGGEMDERAEAVRIIAPLPPMEYAKERARLLSAAEARVLASWTKPKPPTDKAMAKLIAPTAAILPERLFDALALDTGDFQRQGWNRPPASKDELYRRVPLSPLPRRRGSRPDKAETTGLTVARFLLAGRPRPRIEDALKIGELMRLATLARCGWSTDPATGERRSRAPEVFLGKDAEGRPLAGDPAHAHAFWLPQDADGDGFIDHVVVYARNGFDAEARAALDGVTRLWVRERGRRSEEDEAPDIRQEWRLALEGFGTPESFEADVPFLRTSRTWVSATPFLASGHLKGGGHCAEARRLLIRRGIVPADQAHRLEVTEEKAIQINGRDRLPLHFHRCRASRGEAQLDTAGSFLRITLPEERQGPLALGYACHFGLGLFMPADPKPDD